MPAAPFAPQAAGLDDYLSIPVATLLPEQSVGIDLYLRDESGELQLYRSAKIPLEDGDLAKLTDRGVRVLYMPKSAHREYQDYLKENLTSVMADERQPVAARFSMLNSVVRDVLQTSFRNNDIDETVTQSGWIADHCSDLLARNDYVEADLLGVLHHDYHTFTHSANVSFLAAMLARAYGIDDPADTREIVVGGLLHDLGKLDIPAQILTKPSKLSDREFDVIRSHPTVGFEKLCERDDLSYGQLMMVYQHHEKVAGGGYPVGCPKSEIHDWARICTVVDVYEALKANRPYRRPLSTAEIVDILNRDCGKVFDREMLKCWLTVMRRN